MPKTRTLKHDFFLDEELAMRSHVARLLFAGLWLLADRDGRLEDRPLKIKAQIFPYGPEDVDAFLAELDGHFIVRYAVEGRKYIQVVNFKKHQHIHPDEKSCGFPPCPKDFPGNPRKSPEIMHKLYSSVPATYTSPSTSSVSFSKACKFKSRAEGKCDQSPTKDSDFCEHHLIKFMEKRGDDKSGIRVATKRIA